MYRREIFSAIDNGMNYISFWKEMFPDEDIDDKENNLVLCPFHADQEKSLSVSRNGQYKCHACGEEGNAISFLKKAKGKSGGEALNFLCKMARVDKSKYKIKAEKKTPTMNDVRRANNRLL